MNYIKYILCCVLAVCGSAQAFEVRAGTWAFDYQVSWPDSNEHFSDGENVCVRPAAAADYIRAEIRELEADGCTVSQLKRAGAQASFRAICGDTRMDFSYTQQSAERLHLVQQLAFKNGKAYTAAGDIVHESDAQCD